MDPVRSAAALLLAETESDSGGFAAEALHSASIEQRFNRRERRFLTELVLGVLRHRRTLDAVLRAYSRQKLESLDGAVLQALRLGVYQLLFLDGVPPFAAVHETVALLRSPWQRSFANGVLRAVDRETRRVPVERDRGGASPRKRLAVGDHKVCFFPRPVFADPAAAEAEYLADATSHPVFLAERWLQRFGRVRAEKLLRQNNAPPPLFVRSNRLRGTRQETLDRLRAEELRCREGEGEDSVRVESGVTELLATATFQQGYCTVQDETSQKVAPALGPQPGERILDVCAAPGGKATHLAELMGDRGVVLAADRDPARLGRLRGTVERLGLKSVEVLSLDLLEEAAPPAVTGAPLDAVLVDAPCSNSGVLRRRPEARYRMEAAALAGLAALQGALLEAAGPLVRPGGRVLYSTCSLEPEENQLLVGGWLREHPEFQCVREVETLPTKDAGDGGYFAVLQRAAAPR